MKKWVNNVTNETLKWTFRIEKMALIPKMWIKKLLFLVGLFSLFLCHQTVQILLKRNVNT